MEKIPNSFFIVAAVLVLAVGFMFITNRAHITGMATLDTDGDGLLDDEETAIGTSPTNPDTDGDGVLDGLDPAPLNSAIPTNNKLVEDLDNDGLILAEEVAYKTNKDNADTDGDGLNDGFEIDLGLDPLKQDSNNNNMFDDKEDFDKDGLTNLMEQNFRTNPFDPDTDNDWIFDGIEDVNHNGIIDTGETNPKLQDSDGDGVIDGREDHPLDPAKATIISNPNQCKTLGYILNIISGNIGCDKRLNQGGGHTTCRVCDGGDGCGGS